MRSDLIYFSWNYFAIWFTVQNLKLLNYILLFYSQSANLVQTQCFASVSPSGTLRIPGLASWTVVRSGFKVVCQHKLNASNPDDTDNSYHEDLEIHCKIFTSDWSEILHWVYLPWKFKQYNELGLCFFWKSWDKLQQSSYRYVGSFYVR